MKGMAPYEAVISGIGGAFPESNGLDDFIDNLIAGRNVATVDDRRWKPGMLGTSPHLGKIGNVHHFDNNMFRVHKPLAQLMDPLARLMLERSLEAVIDSGLPINALENTNTMVSMTATVSESESRTCSILHPKKAAGYAIMAASKTMMSNRISYFLNLKGPSITLDGDWTVALTALRRAATAIESGECDYALIGAANTCLFPELNKIYESLGFISADGKNRPLDADGAGCFRSEGAVVFLLQRADTARRAYARIAGVAELCVGQRSRFVAISTRSIAPVADGLYRKNGLDTKNVKFLGSDGIALPDIEKAELDAVADVLCKGRKDLPVPVSTSKSVIGTTDAVTALISIIHAIAVMERGCIPPVLHFQRPAPASALQDGRLQVVTSKQELTIDSDSLLAISTLGWSGGIGHAVLRPNIRTKSARLAETESIPRLIIGAGRTESDSKQVIRKIAEKPFDAEYIRLTQEAFSAPIPGYGNRAYAVVPSDVDFASSQIVSKEYENCHRPVWIVYSGMGSQWAGMGSGLMKLPVFAETIQRLQPVLEPEGIDLIHTLTGEDPSLFENIIYSFISIASVQIGLTNLLRSLGVQVSGIVGHSTGELGCAYGDGCLTEEETLLAAYARGKASLSVKLIPGMMASIGMGWKEASSTVPASIDVACHNASDNCTISGPADDVKVFVEELQEKNIFARMVNVSNIAFHSRYVKPAGPVLKELLSKVIIKPKCRSKRWIASSLNPGDELLESSKHGGVEYFVNNLLSPVRFEEAFQSVPHNAVVIEVAPHGLLQPLLRRELPENAVAISLTKRGHPDGMRFLLEAIGKLYLEGVSVKPWILAPEVHLPVSRGTPSLAALASWDHREEWPLIVNARIQISRPRYLTLYGENTPCVRHLGRRLCAPSVLLEIVWRELADSLPLSKCPVKFDKLEFSNPAELQFSENCEIDIQIQRETGLFEVSTSVERWEDMVCLLKGKVRLADETDLVGILSSAAKEQDGVTLSKVDVYAELEDQDLKYDESLKALRRVIVSEREATGLVCWSGQWHILLESLFQLAALTSNKGAMLRSKIRSITIAPQEMKSASNALPVRHDLAQSVLAAPGINIMGYTHFDAKEDMSISCIHMGCQTLGASTSMNNEDFLKSVAIYVTQNSSSLVSAVAVLVLDSRSISVASRLRASLCAVVSDKVAIKVVHLSNGMEFPRNMGGPVVLVANSDSTCHQVARRMELAQGTIYALVSGTKQSAHDFITFAANSTLSLLVKKQSSQQRNIHVVEITDTEEVPEDINVKSRIILVWRGRPREGIFGALASIKGKQYGSRASMVVILDGDAPVFSVHEKIYADQLSLQLVLNVLKDGLWNSLKVAKYGSTPAAIPPSVDGIHISYLGLNPLDLADDAEPAVGVLDYCGLESLTRIMGLARRGADWGAAPDDILAWPVPAQWTDQEAASVPAAYAMAYHSLIVLGRLTKPKEKVFIMNGLSPLGRACVRVALSITSKVVVSVTNEEQKKKFLAEFPEIEPQCALRSDKKSFTFDVRVMSKSSDRGKEDGYDVALVTGTGETIDMVALSSCKHSKIIVFSKTNALGQKVGLNYFVKSSAMIAGGAEAVLSASRRDKEAVKAAVQDGIRAGVVRPIPTEAVQDVDNLDVAFLKRSSKQIVSLNQSASGQELHQKGASYVIAGGHANSMVTVARAASSKGAKIALAANRECGTPMRARFVPSLKRTSFVPYPKTPSDAKTFLSHTTRIENLKAIIVNVEDSDDYNLASLMTGALSSVNGTLKDVRLLVLTESLLLGTETVERWRQLGLHACALVGNRQQASKLLPSLLTVKEVPEVVLVFRNGADCLHAFGTPRRPRPLHSDCNVKMEKVANVAFVELTTLSPRLRHQRHREEPIPLFSVPGEVLSQSCLSEIARNILSPVLMAPEQGHLTAESLAQEILHARPRGPWALFGDAASGPLLLRTARLVEDRAGRPDWREEVLLGLLEDTEHSFEGSDAHGGPLHLFAQGDGNAIKSVMLNERKTKHFVRDANDIATVINDNLLSPLTKIVTG